MYHLILVMLYVNYLITLCASQDFTMITFLRNIFLFTVYSTSMANQNSKISNARPIYFIY